MPGAGESPATTNKPGPAAISHRPPLSLLSCGPKAVKKIVGWPSGTNLPPPESFPRPESVEGIFNSRGLNRLAHSNFVRDFHHHAGGRFLGMAEGKLARCKPARSRGSGGNCGAQGHRFRQPARNSPRQIHRHPGTRGCARYGGFHVLGFRRPVDSRSAIISEQSRRHQIFGSNINIWDDVAHPLQSGTPFDGEGMPRQRVHLVENGVVKRLVYARATAKK